MQNLSASDLEVDLGGKIIPLFTYDQLKGLGIVALKVRLQALKAALQDKFELPPKPGNQTECLIHYILVIQSILVSNVEDLEETGADPQVVMERFFGAPPAEGTISSEGIRTMAQPKPKTPRGEGEGQGRGKAANDPPMVDLEKMEVQCQGKRLPLYKYDQLQHLKNATLVARAREIQESVGEAWGLPKPISRRDEDLISYILCIQSELVSFQAEMEEEDSVCADPERCLVDVFGAPEEMLKIRSTRNSLSQRISRKGGVSIHFLKKKKHYVEKIGKDHFNTVDISVARNTVDVKHEREHFNEHNVTDAPPQKIPRSAVNKEEEVIEKVIDEDIEKREEGKDDALEKKSARHAFGKKHNFQAVKESEEKKTRVEGLRCRIAPVDNLCGGRLMQVNPGSPRSPRNEWRF